MAAQISHIIAGEEALEQAMGAGSVAALGEAAPFFALGCQGPDIFYHNQRTMPSGLHYGALAHRRRYGSLVAGAASALAADEARLDGPSGAYILGLATHAAIDRATHPFIICFSGWADPSHPSTEKLRGCHPFLERILDMGLLENRLGIGASEYGLSARLGLVAGAGARALGDSALEGRLVALWAAGLRAAYPRSTSADPLLASRIANALADARHFYAVTDPAATARGAPQGGEREDWFGRLGKEEGRRLVAIVYPEKMPQGMDAMNLTGKEWRDPSGDGRSSSSSYLDLIEAGRAEATRSIKLILDFWRGALSMTTLAAELGEGGLALLDAKGASLPPRICSPLALSEAMDAEYAARLESHVDLSSPAR